VSISLVVFQQLQAKAFAWLFLFNNQNITNILAKEGN